MDHSKIGQLVPFRQHLDLGSQFWFVPARIKILNLSLFFRIKPFVLNRLANFLPEIYDETISWPHRQKLMLADPEFKRPGNFKKKSSTENIGKADGSAAHVWSHPHRELILIEVVISLRINSKNIDRRSEYWTGVPRGHGQAEHLDNLNVLVQACG